MIECTRSFINCVSHNMNLAICSIENYSIVCKNACTTRCLHSSVGYQHMFLVLNQGRLASIVAVMFATILLPDVTVILRVPVSTVNKLAGIIWPTVYGDVPAVVTTI
jgi:hypothetical protein